jgi:hypothetical protein
MSSRLYVVVVRDASNTLLYFRTRRGNSGRLLREMMRRYPQWHSIDVSFVSAR